MDAVNIGDVTLTPRTDGRLTLGLDRWPWGTTTLTVEGARQLAQVLQAWIREQEREPRPAARADEDGNTHEENACLP
jgi:hypothetical protein